MAAFTFTVTRVGDLTVASTVDWAVTGSGANPATASDFDGGVFPSGTLNFAISDVTAVITVNVASDATVENDEGFTVTLSNSSRGIITQATADGTIQDDGGVGRRAAGSGRYESLDDDYWTVRERYLRRALRPAATEPPRPPAAAPVRATPPPKIVALVTKLNRAVTEARAATTRAGLQRTADRIARISAEIRRIEREQDDDYVLQAILPHLLF